MCRPNRFSFGSRKARAPVAVAATPKKRFGFGSRKPRATKAPRATATTGRGFGFGRRNKRAHHPETVGAPAAIQSIKAKISPTPAPAPRKKNNFAKFAPLAIGKARASGKGPFKKQAHVAPPPARRGFLSGLTSRRRRY